MKKWSKTGRVYSVFISLSVVFPYSIRDFQQTFPKMMKRTSKQSSSPIKQIHVLEDYLFLHNSLQTQGENHALACMYFLLLDGDTKWDKLPLLDHCSCNAARREM